MNDPRIIARDGNFYIRAQDVREGDLLDFQGDKYADTEKTNEITRMGFEFEFAEVESVERETLGCVRIDTDQGSYGFPPEHLIETTLSDKQGNPTP